MSSSCTFEGCTVGETGVCALARDPKICDNHQPATVQDTTVTPNAAERLAQGEDIGSPVLESPASASSFSASYTMGPDAISNLMASRYVKVVGILGEPDSGKTACLVSTYLMIANASLEGWSYADSKSLMAFEDLARGAREWNEGSPPSQMTMHTELMDDRRAGFLHLRMRRASDGSCIDLALSDIPGEWTTRLVTTDQSDRLDFLKSADVIWMVLDGRSLADRERRQSLVARTGQLAGRIRSMFAEETPRVIVVVTHRDSADVPETTMDRLLSELKRKGIEAISVMVAPFSDSSSVRAGDGISALIDLTVCPNPDADIFWPDKEACEDSRSFIKFRRD